MTMSDSKTMEEELKELQGRLAWRKAQKAAEAEVARWRAVEELERKAAEDVRHTEELWENAEAEQWIQKAEEETHMAADAESVEMMKEVDWILCHEMMAKDAEKQKLQEHAVAIHKAQWDFANMKARMAQEEAKQVGLGTLEATQSSLVDSLPGDYQIAMLEALGSRRVAYRPCWKCGSD